MQFNRYSENCPGTSIWGRRRWLLGTSRSRMYCKTHVLELELQGVTWADNGQDCCRLVTRVRNLPINQHDRSCSPGTSETGASSCWWRPRRRQAPDCWLQGLYFLATVWKQTAIVKGQILRRTNELYALFRTTNLNIPIPTAQNGCRTLGCLTQVVQYQPMVISMWAKYVLQILVSF